jgi:hypothetical protein
MSDTTELWAMVFNRIEESHRGGDTFIVRLACGRTLFLPSRKLHTWSAFRTECALQGVFLYFHSFEGRVGKSRWLEAVAEAIQAGRRYRAAEEEERKRREGRRLQAENFANN